MSKAEIHPNSEEIAQIITEGEEFAFQIAKELFGYCIEAQPRVNHNQEYLTHLNTLRIDRLKAPRRALKREIKKEDRYVNAEMKMARTAIGRILPDDQLSTKAWAEAAADYKELA